AATFLPNRSPADLWCPIISVDDHVLEPENLFRDRVEAGYRDRMPRIVSSDQGFPLWETDGVRMPITTGNGAVGRPMSEWDHSPQRFEEFRQAVWDPKERDRKSTRLNSSHL